MAEEASKLRGLEARVAALETKFNFLLQFIRRWTEREEEKKKATISKRQKEIYPALSLSKAAQTLPTPRRPAFHIPRPSRTEPRQFQPLPIPVLQLYTLLIKKKMITPVNQRTRIGPQPKDYNKDLTCEYHQGEVGHTVENCRVLRHRIQDLLDQGVLKFRIEGVINTIGAEKDEEVDITSTKIPWEPLFHELKKRGLLPAPRAPKESTEAGTCQYHPGARDHNLQGCEEFKKEVAALTRRQTSRQGWKELKRILRNSVRERKKSWGNSHQPHHWKCPGPIQWSSVMLTKEKVVLQTASVSAVQSSEKVPSVVIQVPQPFPYQDSKRIPWNYGMKVISTRESQPKTKEEVVGNLTSGLGGNYQKRQKDITGPSFENMVTSILVTNQLTFSDDELPPEGRGHTKALYISVKTNDRIVSRGTDRQWGRPWLHTAGAVPSSLHQKMKLIIGNQLVTILAEEPISIYNDGEIPYIDGCAPEEASFHSFEFVTVIHRVAAVEPRLSKAGIMVAKEFVKAGFQPGQGLGYANQGRTTIVTLEGNKDRYGLGYTPTRRDRQMAYEARRQRAAAKLKGEKWPERKIAIPHIRATFPASAMFQVDEGDVDELALLFTEDLNVNAITTEGDSAAFPVHADQHEEIDLEDFLDEENLKGYRIDEETLDEDTWEDDDLPDLLPHLMVPRGLDTLEFEIFCEHGDPESHLRKYREKMALHTNNEFLMISTFHESLPEHHHQAIITTAVAEEEYAGPMVEGLSIHTIAGEEDSTTTPPTRHCQQGEEVKTWTCVPLLQRVSSSNEITRKTSNDPHVSKIDNKTDCSLDNIDNSDEEIELPNDILEALERQDEGSKPNIEELEIVNLADKGEEPREVKIGTREKSRWNPLRRRAKGSTHRTVEESSMKSSPECKPVKQALRRMKPEVILKIKEEVEKQLKAGFLSTVTYSDWVANIVPVPKKDGKVRMCVDYRDLNRASPKDNFPLPHIDTLVDNTATNVVFSFMDGFSGYNQIKMAEEDKSKTAFITHWGTFVYDVMPFGLKNAGATYQRAMVTLFHDMIHHEIEVYVDDMIAKSRTAQDHLTDLRKLFQRLKKYQLRLNPNKCAFGVTSGKLLGFIVSGRGIEIDPAKLLRKDVKIKWTEDCQRAFDKIKEYLLNPPILVPPTPGRPLILYLTVQEASMGCMLGQQDETGKKEQAIYYLSKKFTEPETRYLLVEKTCCALGLGLQEAETVHALLHHLVGIPDGPDQAIKGQAIADYLADYPSEQLELNGLRVPRRRLSQTNGEWQARDPKLIPYQRYISRLVPKFKYVTFTYTPRAHNHFADALATLASLIKLVEGDDVRPLRIETRDIPAYCVCIEECMNVEAEIDNKPWYYDIKRFIQDREFCTNGTHDATLLRCVDAEEANRLIQEMHAGLMGAHANGPFLARKIMRAGYYWLTMERDCIRHVQTCHKCQMYQNSKNAPPQYLHTMASPWPFSAWGMDVIVGGGMFLQECHSSRGHPVCEEQHHLPVTECQRMLITDNASNLNNRMMDQLCQQFKIQHHNSAPYRPKMNGAVEAANKNVKKILSKMTETYKDWHEHLPYALCAYRTSVRTSVGATPYSLVYGMEAVLPVEVEIPSLRILSQTQLEEAEWAQARYEQLNFIDEKRLAALCHGQLYQRRIERAYNKKARPRTFQPGDLVLKKRNMALSDPRGKFAPSYEGPYVVKKAFSGGAIILADMDGEEFRSPINSDSVIKYHV
uniref:Uncharacterized protein n=1 Tax=Fagus sylvatica TaxID=28930 RepID=A0A2N9FLX8_FAGSY